MQAYNDLVIQLCFLHRKIKHFTNLIKFLGIYSIHHYLHASTNYKHLPPAKLPLDVMTTCNGRYTFIFMCFREPFHLLKI